MSAVSSSPRRPSLFPRRAHDALFRRVHGNTLIYNTCWEDPRLDREMLGLDRHSRVVMITSAGCNALDYLLDGPEVIHAIDMNPRQNALLQLKLALFRHADHEELFRVFGQGVRPGFRELLPALAPSLPPFARDFWRMKHKYFEKLPLNPSFYYRGTSGQIAWLVRQAMLAGSSRVRDFSARLLEAGSTEEQAALYGQVRPALWNVFNSWLVRQPVVMAMLGVPRPQIRLIESEFPGGLSHFVQEKMERVLTRLPMKDNYFWRVYATGAYTPDCCPNYLRPEHFATLHERSGRIRTHTTTVANFLRENPGSYSHYVLLDHQDWLAAHDAAGLAVEWRLILENSHPGTRILMRSASVQIDFLPPDILGRIRLHPEITDRLHPLDRVGTYGSTLLAEVR